MRTTTGSVRRKSLPAVLIGVTFGSLTLADYHADINIQMVTGWWKRLYPS